MLCSACSFENPDGFRFCGRCGANLTAGAPAAGGPPLVPTAPMPPPAARSPDAERRQITLLFCDLVGSTTLGEQFDPEELREIVQGYQAVCASAVAPYGGHIAQYLGDGILIYFGYPVTSEDSPRRAVHAGLAILEGIARLNDRVAARHPLRLAVRVGIHTGAVVTGAVGGAGRTEQLAIGSAPNIAARLQSLAEPDTVVLSGTTYRLVEGFFEFKPLGLHQLKGLSQSVEVYRAIRSTGAVSRFEVIASRGLVPLVGREMELAALLAGFERARSGSGQTIAVVGEPGIGKSRLVEMFRERLSAQPHRWLMSRCSPYASRSALKPIVDTLENLCGIDRATPHAVRRDNLTRFLASFPTVKPDAGALLGALLALPPAPDAPALSLSPERQRQRTLEVLVELVLGSAAGAPLVFAVEDVHWADPSTLELLALLAERTPNTHLLLLVLHRPGTVLPWARNEGAIELPLSRLRDEHVAAIIGHVTAGREIPPGLLQQLVAKTDGVPLFVEELTKMVLESGQDLTLATGLAIPTTLHDSLVARLDHLGSAKEVAQVGAVLGREFSFEMLRAVATHDDATLAAALQTLVESDLIQQHGEAPATVYIFKHALVQDAAYGLMVAAVRQQHHRRAAEVIEARFASLAEIQPELLARHFTEAAAFEPAVRYWLKAAQHANARSANLESIDHATRGLDLLRRLPMGPERSARELGLQITLGTASLTRKGYWAKEVESAFARALELCEQLGDAARRSRALMGLWSYHVVRGDYANGLTLAERLVTEAERQEGTAPRVHALYCLGFTRYYVADFVGALEALSRAASIPVREGDPALTMTTGDDVRVHVLVKRGMAAWHLGQVDSAMASCSESIALARQMGHPYGLAFTLTLSSVVRMYRREPEPARLLAAEAVAIAREKGHSFLSAVSTFVLGWAAAESTDAGTGYAQMRGGRDALRAAGALVGQTMFSAILADVALRRGRADLGVTALADLESILSNGERHFSAEAHRLRGQLNGHEDSLRRALEIANAQGNRSHAVRAAVALAEVLAQHQRKPEAQTILSAALNGLSEALDTPDLMAAAGLLKSLS